MTKVLNQIVTDEFALYHGDCVEVLRGLPDSSVGYTVFSPPFASLYCYSASPRDFGNCRNHAEFGEQFQYLIRDLLRVTKPGRNLSFHCMNLPTSKARDGYIGITDFRGELIRAFVAEGWIYHSEVVIWKDPVTAMQRTKALGLLHKQIKKDSCMSRQGIPDYLVTMRKPGENTDPVSHTDATFPVKEWQHYASPIWSDATFPREDWQKERALIEGPDGKLVTPHDVWMDINASDTLQYMSAREDNDERHICPLQLEVIRRGMRMWTKPGDVVLSPFTGIGSEGYIAVSEGRRFVGAELKRSYFEQACRNLAGAGRQVGLFGRVGA
jgi:hypothetical protein